MKTNQEAIILAERAADYGSLRAFTVNLNPHQTLVSFCCRKSARTLAAAYHVRPKVFRLPLR